MRLTVGLILVLALPAVADELSPEEQLVLQTLRAGERARFERAVGKVQESPLYRADLAFDPQTRTVTGTVVVSARLGKTSLDEVFLRLTPNANHPDAVTLSGAKVNGKPAVLEQVDPSLARVQVKPAGSPGEVVSVEVALTAKVPKAKAAASPLGGGSERGGDYGAFSATPEVACLSGLIPMLPPEKANGELFAGASGIGDLGSFAPSGFLVTLAVPTGFNVVGAGQLVGEVPDGKGAVRFTFAMAAAREFPLLVTRGYEVATARMGEVTIESHYDARDASVGKAVLTAATQALKELDARLGPYPWTKLRVVEAHLSDGAGGMEFPGLITVSSTLYRGAVDPSEALGLPQLAGSPILAELLGPQVKGLIASTLEFTVDHEVAHQYFAMLVGNDPIEAPAADEPLAQHVALLLFEWRHGKKAADELRGMQLKLPFQFHRLLGGADGRADRPTREYQTNSEYAGLLYGKAPMLFDAQRAQVGDEAWLKALRGYVAEYRWKWVEPATLTAWVGKENPGKAKALEALRVRWMDEAHGDDDIGAMKLDFGSLMQGGAAGRGGALGGVQGADLKKLMDQYQDVMKALNGE